MTDSPEARAASGSRDGGAASGSPDASGASRSPDVGGAPARTVVVERDLDGRRLTVTIDRPDVLNALNQPTLRALRAAFIEAADDGRVGVVVLTGSGERAFSTGADLGEQEAFLQRPNDYWSWMGSFIDAIDAIRTCPKPTIARLNGMVVGGGNELNLACDLAVAAEDIAIRHVGPSRGSLPAGGATQWLPITIGDRRAREMLFLNRPVRAPKALEWGLVNRCVPREQLDMEVDNLSHELLAKLPETLRATKAWTHFWKDLSWGLTIRQAREWLTIHAASTEVREGLESFRDKRMPDYEALRESTAVAGAAGSTGAAAARRTRFCPGCGNAVEPDFRFCPSCGSALIAAGEGGLA